MLTKTAYQKMLAGELYDAGDAELVQLRTKARTFLRLYNQTDYDQKIRSTMLRQLLRSTGVNIDIQTPFFCDYGCHISVGNNFFANFNCVFLDCNYINIGDNVSFGPNVQVYAASHPVISAERIKGPELGLPIALETMFGLVGVALFVPE